jgi:hypothetical protein
MADELNMGAGTDSKLIAKAMGAVMAYVETHLEKTDPKPYYNVYMVWFCKSLKNWKALLSTTLPDGMYYEVTYNGNTREMYVDAYKKFANLVIPDEEANDAPISSDPAIHRS